LTSSRCFPALPIATSGVALDYGFRRAQTWGPNENGASISLECYPRRGGGSENRGCGAARLELPENYIARIEASVSSAARIACWCRAGPTTSCLQLRRGERIARADRAGLEAGHEPALALRRAAVGEAVRHHVALRSSLQGVVADRRRSLHGSLDVARLYERRLALTLQIVVLELRPHAGETVGLQLDPHLDRVRFGLATRRLLQLLRLRQDAEQVLHVVADLVRDHVGLRELAGAALATAESGLDLLEERGV